MNDKESYFREEFDFDDIQIAINKNRGIKIRNMIIKSGLLIVIVLVILIIILIIITLIKRFSTY
jgi:hypothetical protein